MTDLEITKLCAEAMGLQQFKDGSTDCRAIGGVFADKFNPLRDDAQAMVLVKKFHLWMDFLHGEWRIQPADEFSRRDKDIRARNKDLNRAICECVAKMQQVKK